jgi:hypothetical protein
MRDRGQVGTLVVYVELVPGQASASFLLGGGSSGMEEERKARGCNSQRRDQTCQASHPAVLKAARDYVNGAPHPGSLPRLCLRPGGADCQETPAREDDNHNSDENQQQPATDIAAFKDALLGRASW